jgi:hypothetical protein
MGAVAATLLPLTPAMTARAASVSVLNGTSYRTAIFPNDQLTKRDLTQVTKKRVDFRQGIDYPACDSTNYSICDGFTMLDKLDGFDIQPRVTIPFTGPIDIKSVNDSDVFVQGPGGRTQLMQLVWDPASLTLSGITNAMLYEASLYNIVVTSAVKDASGNPIDACGGTCVVPFTTRSATSELIKIRQSLDDGSAFTTAGIPSVADRKLGFTQNGIPDVFPAPAVLPSIASQANGIVRLDQTTTDPDPSKLQSSVVPNLVPPGFSGTYSFGSFKSPRYQYRSTSLHQDDLNGYTDGVIPTVPSKQTPQPFGYDQLGVIMVLPAGPPPAGGWPVAIYGPGFTRSKYDIFVTADYNATLGVATVATDPAGHGYGTASEAAVTTATGTTTFLSYGRGRDLDGDGCIADGLLDGVGPTPHRVRSGGTCANPTFSSQLPSHKTVDGLQSGLLQTAIDNMTLQRAIASGVDIPTVGNDVLSHTNIYYYGLSFGSIYGTMLMGADNHLSVGLLNVGGGPIIDIARLSSFRGNLHDSLAVVKPSLLNGGPGLNGFTESIPLRQDPPVTKPYPGAMQLQELFAATNWYDRSGSPESFAPLLRLRKPAGQPDKKLLFQSAYGDATVPNVTAGTMYRAGDLFDLVTYFRHDKSAPGLQQSNPHGWLADPTIDPVARTAGEQQLGIWLASGGTQRVNTNPLLLETPAATIGNFDCLHYADPETGGAYSAPSFPNDSRECPTIAQDLKGGWLDPLPIPDGDSVHSRADAVNGATGVEASGVSGASTLPFTSAAALGAGPAATLGLILLGALVLVAGYNLVRRRREPTRT